MLEIRTHITTNINKLESCGNKKKNKVSFKNGEKTKITIFFIATVIERIHFVFVRTGPKQILLT